jgi:hypothetical protein
VNDQQKPFPSWEVPGQSCEMGLVELIFRGKRTAYTEDWRGEEEDGLGVLPLEWAVFVRNSAIFRHVFMSFVVSCSAIPRV